jgi:hypothetical protein
MKECDNSTRKIHIRSNFILSISLLIMYSGFRTDFGKLKQMCVVFDFGREIGGNCAVVGCYAASSGQFLDDVSGQPIGPILRVPQSKRISNYYYSLHNNPRKA